jgi:hypothetical protein
VQTMGKAKPAPALHMVKAPPEPDRLTIVTSELLLAINRAVIELTQMPADLSPSRSARAEILQHLLGNVRASLMEA